MSGRPTGAVLITLLGWLAAVGGALRIVMPQGTQEVGRKIIEHPQGLTIAAVIWLVIGAVLCLLRLFPLTPRKRETRR